MHVSPKHEYVPNVLLDLLFTSYDNLFDRSQGLGSRERTGGGGTRVFFRYYFESIDETTR